MYRIIQFIRHKIPLIWEIIDYGNNLVFCLRYGRKMRLIPKSISKFDSEEIKFSVAADSDIEALTNFFNSQPESSFVFFKPHNFDRISIKNLIDQESFIMIIASTKKEIVGYAFIRCFANGKSFRGKIVDINHRGLGIGKMFGELTMEIASTLGIRLFGTISRLNISSMKSSKSSNIIKVIKELPNDYLLIQYFPKEDN